MIAIKVNGKRHEVDVSPTTPLLWVLKPGVPPIAPAVANALFTLTAKRIRKLPVRL